MKIGYARVSTKDQSFDLQTDALKKVGCKKIFKEVISGARTQSKVLDEVMATLRPKDVLVIWKLDRLGRSLRGPVYRRRVDGSPDRCQAQLFGF
jgi:DNA invertase Pin-like site-specific DNA recombinase